jgi:polyisoprenoid-binding protein YceI
MAIAAGSYRLGPENGTLSVRTKKAGAAAVAAHNLLIEVGTWQATIEIGEDRTLTRAELSADSRSLKVIDATGGVTTLGDDDKAGITQTINEEVLKGTSIAFVSSGIESDSSPGHARVSGELELGGQRHPIAFELETDADGRMTGSATVKQSAWGIKPYSALFGTLKVIDEVAVEIAARLPES